MRVTTTPEEDKFVAEAATEFYDVAIAADAFQRTVLKILREITNEFDSKLTRLGLPFEKASENKGLAPNPWIQRKIALKHLEAGVCLVWLEDDPKLQGKRICVYWWIWLKDRDRRETVSDRLRATTKKPFAWEPDTNGTSCISLYFSPARSGRIKEHSRRCADEFIRVLSGCRKVVTGSASPDNSE